MKDSLLINNNNNYSLNYFNRAYNKILFPEFHNSYNFKNNFYNPMNIFPYYSYFPLNQENAYSINNNRNANYVNNFLLGKKNDNI